MPASTEGIASLLAGVPAFAELGPQELAEVAAVAVPRSFAPGESVFREGDASNTCYVVRDGRARAIREHADGRQITLATFGPGDIFEELDVLAILGSDMRRLMREHADIAVKLAVALVRRLRSTNERLAQQSFQTVQSRVATALAQLVDQARAAGAAERDVEVTTTQADLAKLAGSSRESASRFLAVL